MLELIGWSVPSLQLFSSTSNLCPFNRSKWNQHWDHRRNRRDPDTPRNRQVRIWLEVPVGGMELLRYSDLVLEGLHSLLFQPHHVRPSSVLTTYSIRSRAEHGYLHRLATRQQKIVKWTAIATILAYCGVIVVIWGHCTPVQRNWQVVPYPGDECTLAVPNYLSLVVLNVT